MALSDLWSRRKPEPESTSGSTTLAEITTEQFEDMLKEYNLIEVSDEPGQQYAIVAPKSTSEPLGRELGSTSPSPWTSFNRREYNTSLQGARGLEQYDKMRKGDGTVRGSLRIFKTPVLAASWFCEPGGTRRKDKQASDWVWENLQELMSISFTQVLTESLLMCDFGYYMFEKVWENRVVDGKLRTVLKKLAPRHPMDIEAWELDANGGPVGVWFTATAEDAAAQRNDIMSGQNQTQTGLMPGMINIPVGTVSGIPNLALDEHPYAIFIPIEKLLVFTFDKEAGNIEGVSVLRSAYKHWYYKEQLYKIDAIQKERHGIGIPVIKLPVGYKDDDKRAAEELGRNIRTNERAHIVLPPGWEVSMLKLEGTPMDCLKSITHHDELIEKNVVGYFLSASSSSNASTLVDMFLKSSRFLADIVRETFNMYLVPQMVDYNFTGTKNPKLNYRHIGDTVDWRTMSFAIRNFIGAGVIKPDDVLEENVRAEMGLPKADPATTREVATPQAGPNAGQSGSGNSNTQTPNPPKPPKVGPPRQAPVGKQRNTQGLPKGNVGQDTSGGK